MDRRRFAVMLLTVSITGCVTGDDGSTAGDEQEADHLPQGVSIGLHPVNKSDSDDEDSIEVIRYSELSSKDRSLLDDLMPDGGIECEKASRWGSVAYTLTEGDREGEDTYLEREGRLYGLSVTIDDQSWLHSAEYRKIEFEGCESRDSSD